jgi:hypothetical protein
MPAKKTTETVKKTNDEVPEVPVVKKTRAKKTAEAPTETPVEVPVEVVKKSRAKKTPEVSTEAPVEVVKKSRAKKSAEVAAPVAPEVAEPEVPEVAEPEVPTAPVKKPRAKKAVPEVTPVVEAPAKKSRAKKTTEKPKNDDDELSDALLEKLLEAKKTEWADITKQISNLNAEREKLSVLQQTLLNELHDLMNKIKKEPTDNTFVLEKKETKNLLSMNHISDSDTDSSPNSDDESDSETFNKSVLANKQPVKGKKLISKVNSDSESD